MKTKTDLAVAAGLPTEDFVFVKPKKAKAIRKPRKVFLVGSDHYLATTRACAELQRDMKAATTYAGTLDGIEKWMTAVGKTPDPEKLRGTLTDAIKEILK
jgi:hypothetical protein